MTRLLNRLRGIHPLTVAATVAAVAIIAVGALTAALIAVGIGHSTAHCLNTTLGSRNPAASADAQAHIAAAQAEIEHINADLAFASTLVPLVAHPGAQASPVAIRAFIAEIGKFPGQLKSAKADLLHAEATLAADQAYRARHPLGTC